MLDFYGFKFKEDKIVRADNYKERFKNLKK